MAGHHLAALLLQRRDHRVGQRLRAALDQRPADVVGQHRRAASRGGGQRPGQVEHPVRGGAGEQRLCLPRCRSPVGQPADVGQPVEPEAARSGRAPRGRAAQLAGEEEVEDVGAVLDQRPEQPAVGGRVGAEPRGRLLERAGDTAARPPSSGWAKQSSGWTSRTPRLGRSNSRKNGAAAAIGCTVEQTSWRYPGRISSSVRMPPPGRSPRLDHLHAQTRRPPAAARRPARSGRPRRRRRPVVPQTHSPGDRVTSTRGPPGIGCR